MRARGQGLLAVAVVALVVLAGIVARRVGPNEAPQAHVGSAPSGAWLCPHGGGEDWTAALYLENPGDTPVQARVSPLGSGNRSAPSRTVTVAAGSELRLDVPADERGASTYVEYFGGWIGAGWVTRGGAGELGIGAEPCAPQAARTWYTADNITRKGQDAFLVVMNPFAADAIFDVALYTARRAPIRDSDWTDITLKAHRSVALLINKHALDEEVVAAGVEVASGRVAVASLGVTRSGGIRSSLGWPGTATRALLPVSNGSGQSQVVIAVPGELGVQLGASALSKKGPGAVQGLLAQALEPQHVRVYPVSTDGPSAIDVRTLKGGRIAAALRSLGVGNDSAATSGTPVLASRWVVTPTVGGEPALPGMVLANPGEDPVEVSLHLLPRKGQSPADDAVLTIPAASTLGVPVDFLASAPDAGVLVSTDGPGIVAMGSSTSLGVEAKSVYALAMGIALPPNVA